MSARDKARPQHVGGLVKEVLQSRGLYEDVERASAFPLWEEIVGAEIARVASPVGFNRETLFVEVRSSAWLMELQMMERSMLAALNENRRTGKFERIIFKLAEGR